MTRWKWPLICGLSGLWLVGTAVFAAYFITATADYSRTYEIIRFCFLSISAFGVLFASLLTSFNSLEASLNVRERIAFDRMENTFTYMHRWDSSPLTEARDFTRKIRAERDKLSAADLRQRISSDASLHRSVVATFNFFEELELAILADRVDPDHLRRAFGQLYCDIFDRFEPWVSSLEEDGVKASLKDLRDRWRTALPRPSGSTGGKL